MPFFGTICSKKISCSHQALGVVQHCKTALDIKVLIAHLKIIYVGKGFCEASID